MKIYDSKKHAWINIDDDDYDKISDYFAQHEIESREEAIEYAKDNDTIGLSLKYTESEIAGMFDEFAEENGLTQMIEKRKTASDALRQKARKELEEYIEAPSKRRKDITLASAKVLLKIVKEFERYK